MALITTAVTLQTVINSAHELYFSKLLEFETILGRATNNIFQLSDEPVLGHGKHFKFKRSFADSFRPDTDALSGFGTSRAPVYEDLEVRFNERSTAANDFTKVAGASRVSEYQILKAEDEGDAAIVDIVSQLTKDFRKDYEFKKAVLRNMDRTARLGTVNGTKLNNTDLDFASCTTYSAGATSCRIQIDQGAIGWFREGQILDIVTAGGTMILDNVQVVDEPNAYDLSVGIAITGDTVTAANCDGISNAHEIFWSGSRNKGLYSIGELFNTPGANYIGGKDRTDAHYRALQSRRFRITDVARKVSKSDFDKIGDTLATQYDEPDTAYSSRMQQDIQTAMRAQFEAAAFIPWPTDSDARKRFANYGSDGLTFRHPALGLIVLKADPFMKPKRMQMLCMDDMLALYYKNKGLRIMPGGIAGVWDRMESTIPGEGKSMFYQMQGYSNLCDWCLFPRRQVELQNITAS